ncbi:gluconeogenesis factor YvcK family protein [Aquihabitans sp. McL0605]|uniref:gluconeogenesis factor YvcK family protein n=1 Tax=Aquihabitans sp. McL0605 TaxID=3415671 RepID=UPI003CF04C20
MVAVGGGHGLSASLRAVRRYAGSITAVVSVADDGGSSGRLRAEMPELPAPGDVRTCLAALAADGSPFARILEHRFDDGDLEGHALGNLILAALAHELGSFAAAVDEVGARVGAVGRVLPATVGPVALEALVAPRGEGPPADGPSGPATRVVGQVAVQNASGVYQVRLRPDDASSSPDVGAAIEAADQVILGPGSLFTSVLAAAIVPAVHRALRATGAQRIYVANLAPELPETAGFTVADEVRVLAEHGVEVDVVVVDEQRVVGRRDDGICWVQAPVADDRSLVHHPERLAAVLAALAPTSAPPPV